MRLHLFQDPFTGDLWPRGAKTLEFAVTTLGEDGNGGDWPRLDESTPGSDRTYSVSYLRPERDIARAPSTSAFGSAVRAWLRDMPEGKVRFSLVGDAAECVQMAGTEPEPMWLVTQLYVPDEEALEARWRVADPFFPGDLPWLRRRLDGLRRRPAITRDMLNRTIGRLVDQEEAAGDETSEYIALGRFGAELPQHEELYELVVDLEAARSTLGANRDEPNRVRRTVAHAATCSGKVLDLLCTKLLTRFPIRGGADRIRELLRLDLPRLGWGECPTGWVEKKMAGDELRTSEDLVALLARTAAAAVQHPGHPWRAWLGGARSARRLDDLRHWRNDHSHLRSKRRGPPSDHDPVVCINNVLELVEHSLPHLGAEPK